MGLDSEFWSADEREWHRDMERKKNSKGRQWENSGRRVAHGEEELRSFHHQRLCFPCPHLLVRATTNQSKVLYSIIIQSLLLGLRLEFPPGCPELPGHAASRPWPPLQSSFHSPWWSLAERTGSAHPTVPCGNCWVGLASWSIEVPGCVTLSDRQRSFSWATARQAPGNVPPATCHVATELSHKDACCWGQRTSSSSFF